MIIIIDEFLEVNKKSLSESIFRPTAYVSVQEDNLLSVISSQDFEVEKLHRYKKFVIKSDIEGWDARVLGNFSENFWSNVEAAVIEVQSNPKVDSLDYLLSELVKFDFLSWDPIENQKLTREEISSFWQSHDPGVRNLYAKRIL